ncbi:MAG TPA: hypothetical protein VK211_13465, partial [Kamptonema sp.]|nr:hypothetical protein [Kamptonema sp.]
MLIIQHLWQFILFLVILFGPLPLCLALALINQKENSRYSLVHCLLVLLTTWSIIQVGLCLILGTGEKLILNTVILSEILIFIIGISLIYSKKYSLSFVVKNLPHLKQSLNKMELLIIGATAFVGFAIANILATDPITNYDSLWFHLPA